MSACTTLTESASAGVAPALRAVDCLASETTAAAFGRLFGTDGALLPALTVLMTLYVAWFAVSLMTGRSRIGISALTPRMMTLGLVLTLATSWVAYQNVVWNLAIGAPDEIASVLMGTAKASGGSATQVFADRIDLIFAVIAEVGQATTGGAESAAQGMGQGSFSPGNLMWLAALLLLLGTVGILVTARIALAVLLALGPVFVIFALFSGTRGLTAGWLRGVVLTAVTPLFVVLGGGIMLELLVPVVANLNNGFNGVDGRSALALFTIAAVHLALMAMVLRVMGALVGGWQVFGLAQRESAAEGPRGRAGSSPAPVVETRTAAAPPAPLASRRLPVAAAAPTGTGQDFPRGSDTPTVRVANGSRSVITHQAATGPALPPRQAARARGIGSRFQSPTRTVRELAR